MELDGLASQLTDVLINNKFGIHLTGIITPVQTHPQT